MAFQKAKGEGEPTRRPYKDTQAQLALRPRKPFGKLVYKKFALCQASIGLQKCSEIKVTLKGTIKPVLPIPITGIRQL